MSTNTAADRENRLRRLKMYSGRDPVYGDKYKISNAVFDDSQPAKQPADGEEVKMKVKKGMSSKPGQQQKLLCHTFDVRKRKLRPGELSAEDKADVARAFGATDGVSIVDSREFTLDSSGWH